jgi:hypothetical protein
MRMAVHGIKRPALVLLKNGHLEVLRCAHENGCPWDEDSGMVAAENGHLEA